MDKHEYVVQVKSELNNMITRLKNLDLNTLLAGEDEECKVFFIKDALSVAIRDIMTFDSLIDGPIQNDSSNEDWKEDKMKANKKESQTKTRINENKVIPFGLTSLTSVGETEFLGKTVKEEVTTLLEQFEHKAKDAEDMEELQMMKDFAATYITNENPLSDTGIYHLGWYSGENGRGVYARRMAPLSKTKLESGEFTRIKNVTAMNQYDFADPDITVLGTEYAEDGTEDYAVMKGSEIQERVYSWLKAYAESSSVSYAETRFCDQLIRLVNSYFYGKYKIDTKRNYQFNVKWYTKPNGNRVISSLDLHVVK